MHTPAGFIYNGDKAPDEYNAYTGHVCFIYGDGKGFAEGNANTDHVCLVYRLVHSV